MTIAAPGSPWPCGRLDETQLTALLSVLRTVRAAIAEDMANDEGPDQAFEAEDR